MKQMYGLFAGLLLGSLSISLAQSAGLMDMPQVMTAPQLSASGISSLSESQRKALDDWLDSYTRRVIRVTKQSIQGPIFDNSGKHWIDETCHDGAIVILEDDSVWEIEGPDQVDTNLWLPTTDVTVTKNSEASGPYKYVLRNTEDHETAHARYIDTL